MHNVWKSPKLSQFSFSTMAFSNNFCPIESDLSGNTVWQQASGFQHIAKLTISGIFNKLLSTQNVNVARNVEFDFFCDFRIPCLCTLVYSVGYTLPFEFKTRVCNHFSTLVFELKRFLFNCFPPKKSLKLSLK